LNPVAARAGLVAGGLGAQHASHQIGDGDAGKRRLGHVLDRKQRIEIGRQQTQRRLGRRNELLDRLIDVVHEMAQRLARRAERPPGRHRGLPHARLSPEALGLDLLAFMLVAWSDPKVEPRFLEKIQASPDVLECHHITGAWNYILKVRVGTTRDLETFLAQTVKAVEGALRTETIIVLSSAKETRGR